VQHGVLISECAYTGKFFLFEVFTLFARLPFNRFAHVIYTALSCLQCTVSLYDVLLHTYIDIGHSDTWRVVYMLLMVMVNVLSEKTSHVPSHIYNNVN
jgi:hypothetical protein